MQTMVYDVKTAAEHFSVVSRMDCLCLSLRGVPPEHGGECVVCEAALQGHVPPPAADPVHRFAAYQAERLGGAYIYICPYSLLHIAAPIIVDEMLESVLVCGPTVLSGLEEQAFEHLASSKAISLFSEDAAQMWLSSLPRLTPKEATASSDVLARIALSCCDVEGAARLREPPSQESASDIARYLDYLTTMEGEKRGATRYPVEAERRLMDAVAAGERENAEALLRYIAASVLHGGETNVEAARSRILELVVLLSRAAIAGGADVELVFGLEFRSLKRLRELQSVEGIEAWLSRILRRFIDLVFDLRDVRYFAHLSRVLSYTRNHFREHLTVGRVAAEAGLSAGYLSRILRSELNTTFTRYLRTLRLEEAKRLLRYGAMPVGDVGAACGFPDHSYFAKVFRRETGLSPSDYRMRRAHDSRL